MNSEKKIVVDIYRKKIFIRYNIKTINKHKYGNSNSKRNTFN